MNVPLKDRSFSSETALDIRGISFDYDGRRAIDDITMSVSSGDLFGILGPNGSGKSTLVSLLSGLDSPLIGDITVFGSTAGSHARKQMGILFQESSLDLLMTPTDVLRLHGKLFCMNSMELRDRIPVVLDMLGLSGRENEIVAHLSGGMRRRLELARSLLANPKLLLLDEPTVGLDPSARASLWSYLTDINKNGTTLVVATNDVQEAERYFSSVAFLHKGHLVACGSPSELKKSLNRDSVQVEWPSLDSDVKNQISSWDGVGKTTWSPPILHVTVDNASSFIPHLFNNIDNHDIKSVSIRDSTLEDAYFQLVGSSIGSNSGDNKK